mgnify:CR=1 FL=1
MILVDFYNIWKYYQSLPDSYPIDPPPPLALRRRGDVDLDDMKFTMKQKTKARNIGVPYIHEDLLDSVAGDPELDKDKSEAQLKRERLAADPRIQKNMELSITEAAGVGGGGIDNEKIIRICKTSIPCLNHNRCVYMTRLYASGNHLEALPPRLRPIHPPT